jgi:hypothetical protein
MPLTEDVITPVDAASQTVCLTELLPILSKDILDSIGLFVQVVCQDEWFLYTRIVATVAH